MVSHAGQADQPYGWLCRTMLAPLGFTPFFGDRVY
jgi:hypothetical protein